MQVEHASGRHRLTGHRIYRIARHRPEIRDAVNASRLAQGLDLVEWPTLPEQLPEALSRGVATVARIRAALAATR